MRGVTNLLKPGELLLPTNNQVFNHRGEKTTQRYAVFAQKADIRHDIIIMFAVINIIWGINILPNPHQQLSSGRSYT